ncbi:MAG: acetyltransferase, partial [Symbiobacteriaceae bacterium]|nr:acetyltransferase [Symbiobacteriaceae bacterium]
PLLKEMWGTFTPLPSVEYRYNRVTYGQRPLPAGFRLTAVGPEHLEMLCQYRPAYRKAGTIGDFLSYDDFFAHGFGYAVIDEAAGKIVAACMAHAVSARRVDHALRTLKGYEGMGLATACVYATIMEGVRRGLDPVWITEVDNHGSRAIAEKIGLKLTAEYLLFDRD